MSVRTERTFEVYSRGHELVNAIREAWKLNELDTWLGNNVAGWIPPSRAQNLRIETIVKEHDLTAEEWHYWCRVARMEAAVDAS